MYPNNDRVITLLSASIKEMDLIGQMCADISSPDDFVSSLHGLTTFRACGMSLQYVTENFVKIRNLMGVEFFNPYKEVPWKEVFDMRNILSHEYGDADPEGIFNTVKEDIPTLLETTKHILEDLGV